MYGDNGSEYATVKSAWAAVGVGEPDENFSIIRKQISPNLAIPDNDPTGIESTIYVEESGLLKDINIGIVIEHSYIGDLRVTLTSPIGESVVLHDRQGGALRDIIEVYDLESFPALNMFAGDNVQGNWRLNVSDNARVDTGKIALWEMELSTLKAEKKELTQQVSPNQPIPDNKQNGIESLIEVSQSGVVVRLDVSVDISHTWIGDLRVLLISPSGIEVALHDRSGRSRNDIKMTYSTTIDDALLALLGEEIQGNWRLKVSDHASRDRGTLNSWGIHCVYE